MQSSNPAFTRAEGFNGRGGTSTYSDPSTWGTGAGAPGQSGSVQTDQGRMTIDSVVQKTGVTLGVLVLAAFATWVFMPPALYSTVWIGAAFAALGLSLVISFAKQINPVMVLIFAAVEGVFVGAASATFAYLYDGVVVGAVLGTIAAVAGTLTAYKIFDIKVTAKFRKIVVAAMFGFVAVSLLNFVMSFFSDSLGVNGYGTMGLVFSFIGLAIGIGMLILDFDFVERGIAAGLPERESWRAAFGLTVTIVWIYINLLRILAIFQSD